MTQFFDLVAEERAAQRDHEILETLDAIHQTVEDVFALALSLTLAANPARRASQ